MKAKRKNPQRQCVGCRKMKDKRDLIRVIKTPEDLIDIDITGKINGRGAYLCNSVDCFIKAKNNKSLERSLKKNIPEDVYEKLEKELNVIGE